MRLRAVLTAIVVAATLISMPAGSAHAAGGSSFVWQGSANGSGGDNHSWTDPRNWIPNGVPADGSSVAIDDPDAAHCTAAVDNVPAVALVGFSLAATRCSSSVKGGAITVTGTFNWNGGSIFTPTTIAAGATGTIAGSNAHLSGLAANLDVAGTLTLSGIPDSGASNQGGFRIANPQVLHVLAGGQLISSGPNAVQPLSCCNNPARIVNDGTIVTSGGDLLLHGIAVDEHGAINAAAGSRLVSDLGPATASSGASYTGGGSWMLYDGSTLKLDGTQTLQPGFRLQVGTMGADGSVRIGGTATLTGGGKLDWQGGTIEGNLTIAHGTTLSAVGAHTGNGGRFLSGTDGLSGGVASQVTNHGSMAISGGAGLTTGYAAQLVNASDGVLAMDPGTVIGTISCCVNPSRVVNSGALTVPTGSSAAAVQLSGVAYRASGGSAAIAVGRTMVVSDAPSSLANTTVRGGGRLEVAAPTAASGTVNVSGSEIEVDPGGSLDGTATFAGSGSVRWIGGSMSGHLTVGVAAGLRLGGTAPKSLANVAGGAVHSQLSVTGPMSFDPGTGTHQNVLDLGQSTLQTRGNTHLSSYAGVVNGAVLNTGHLTADPGAAYAFIGSGLTNRGTVTVARGTLRTSLTLAAGTLDGTGTISGGVTNQGGTVSPGGAAVGTLHIVGAYAQGAGGHLALTMGSASRDLLSVSGHATLAGTLLVHNVGYTPRVGQSRRVLTASSVTSGLRCTATSGTGSGRRHWAATHGATWLNLVARKGALRSC